MYKSQLQEFAQKAGLLRPVYESSKEGPSHQPKFRASVSVSGNTYQSPLGFTTLKAAEHAAAKAALDAIHQSGCAKNVVPSTMHESGLCKNILQEHAQKLSLPLPLYRAIRSGQEHAPMFTSTVEVGGVLYSGGPASNKKEAEIKAARTALIVIQGQSCSGSVNSELNSELCQADLGSPNVIKPSQPRHGMKKRGREQKGGTETRSVKNKDSRDESMISPANKLEAIQNTEAHNTQQEHTQKEEQPHVACTSISSLPGALPLSVGSS